MLKTVPRLCHIHTQMLTYTRYTRHTGIAPHTRRKASGFLHSLRCAYVVTNFRRGSLRFMLSFRCYSPHKICRTLAFSASFGRSAWALFSFRIVCRPMSHHVFRASTASLPFALPLAHAIRNSHSRHICLRHCSS